MKPVTVEAQVAALAKRYRLDADESGRLMTLLELLVEDPLAPTAIRDPHKAADEHLADALVGVEYAAPLLRVGGTLVAWRGRRDREAEAAAVRAAERLGLEVGEVRRVRPFPGAEHRHLHLMLKVIETPRGFPRRPGIAAKRP